MTRTILDSAIDFCESIFFFFSFSRCLRTPVKHQIGLWLSRCVCVCTQLQGLQQQQKTNFKFLVDWMRPYSFLNRYYCLWLRAMDGKAICLPPFASSNSSNNKNYYISSSIFNSFIIVIIITILHGIRRVFFSLSLYISFIICSFVIFVYLSPRVFSANNASFREKWWKHTVAANNNNNNGNS